MSKSRIWLASCNNNGSSRPKLELYIIRCVQKQRFNFGLMTRRKGLANALLNECMLDRIAKITHAK